MEEQSLLGRAVAIAAQAHQAQHDKAGAPYILHPLRMMMRARTVNEQTVAVLHDVVEDSPWTFEQLAAEGFSTEILAALDCVTARPDESYDHFLDRVLTNALARRVKLLDIEDNMDMRRIESLTEKDLRRLEKYHNARARLLAAIGDEKSAIGNEKSAVGDAKKEKSS